MTDVHLEKYPLENMVQTEIHRGQMCARSSVLFAQPLKGSVTRVPERRVKKIPSYFKNEGWEVKVLFFML